jgi:ornithine carbamoyltransferase
VWRLKKRIEIMHFLEIKDFSKPQLREILDSALKRKTARADLAKGERDFDLPLKGKIVALVFERPSTRTRFSSRHQAVGWGSFHRFRI